MAAQSFRHEDLRLIAMKRCSLFFAALAVLGLGTLSGCSREPIDPRIEMGDVLDTGDTEGALRPISRALATSSNDSIPDDLTGDSGLWLLERGTVQLALGNAESSARDFTVGSPLFDEQDLSHTEAEDLLGYLYANDSSHYRSTMYEKFAAPVFSELAYLEKGDLEGARVEARKFETISKFSELETEFASSDIARAGHLISGFISLQANRKEDAALHFEEAGRTETAVVAPQEVLLVIGTGRVAPIITETRSGVLLPALSPREDAPPAMSVLVDGTSVALHEHFSIAKDARSEWAALSTKLEVAAVSRKLLRDAATKAAGSALSVEPSTVDWLTPSTNEPDTRSWASLPANLWVERITFENVAARIITLQIDGESTTIDLSAQPRTAAIHLRLR